MDVGGKQKENTLIQAQGDTVRLVKLRIEVDAPHEATVEEIRQAVAHIFEEGKDGVKELLCADYAAGEPLKSINNLAIKLNVRVIQ